MNFLTTSYPTKKLYPQRNDYSVNDLKLALLELQDNFVAILDEFNAQVDRVPAAWVKGKLNHATIEACNITTNKKRILSMQIANLIADKIIAGTIDLSKGITITDNEGGILTITKNALAMHDKDGRERLMAGWDENAERFIFMLQNADGTAGVGLDDEGNAVFSGTIDTRKDVKIGQNLYIRTTNVSGEETAKITFGSYNSSGNWVESARINFTDGGTNTPTLNVVSKGDTIMSNEKASIHLKGNDLYVQSSLSAGGKTYIRGGSEVRIGTNDGNDRVYINNELAATQKWVQNNFAPRD